MCASVHGLVPNQSLTKSQMRLSGAIADDMDSFLPDALGEMCNLLSKEHEGGRWGRRFLPLMCDLLKNGFATVTR